MEELKPKPEHVDLDLRQCFVILLRGGRGWQENQQFSVLRNKRDEMDSTLLRIRRDRHAQESRARVAHCSVQLDEPHRAPLSAGKDRLGRLIVTLGY